MPACLHQFASGAPDLSIEGFEPEEAALVQDRLMLMRAGKITKDRMEEEIRRWFFRHDKIPEFFLLPAFLDDRAGREAHSLDERFFGVYELLAVRLPDEEEALQQHLVRQAALTGRSEILSRYTFASRARPRSAPAVQPAACA